MNIKELKGKIGEQQFRWNRAKQNGNMINQESERMKNILLNNVDEIMEVLTYAEGAADRIEILMAEMDDADRELQELDEEIKRLKGESEEGECEACTIPEAADEVETPAEEADVQ